MKAIILAGGGGERLRPLTAETPKPMVPLLGAPLLEHSLRLLRRRGIRKVALTLHYLSEVVEDHFGDGSAMGMDIRCYREEEPLGTAGAVARCRDFWQGEETVLVLSGDALWDLDLEAALDFHRRNRFAATLLLHRARRPLEYGLVRTGGGGRVIGFVEKPGWGQVFTDQVNTGIYLLSQTALEAIPEQTKCDFARDLFPALLEREVPLGGYVPDGYWKDIGDTTAYLEAVRDALEGKIRLELDAPERKRGIWCASPLPEGVKLIPPCYISEKVSVAEGAVLGPRTVLEPLSRVERGAEAEETVLMRGAALEAEVRCRGAILCPEAAARRGAVLGFGTVLGPRAEAAEHAVLRPGARLWSDVHTVPGERCTGTLTAAGAGRLCFGDRATLTGAAGQELTAEHLLQLGRLLGEEGTVGLGYYGQAAARSLLTAAAAGVTAAGGTALLHDGTTPAVAAWVAREQALPVSLFLSQEGERLTLWLLDRWGLPLSRERQRRLEAALLQGIRHRSPAHRVGEQRTLTGADAAFVRAAVRQGTALPPLRFHVPRRGRGNVLLREALSALGMVVQTGEGPLSLSVTADGTGLWARDEENRVLPPEQCLLLTERLVLEGGERRVFLPSDAPEAARTLAQRCGAAVLPLEADREGACGEAQRPLRWGVFAACALAGRMARTGERLTELAASLPLCVLKREELSLSTHRSSIMRALTERFPEAESTPEGLRVTMEGGSVFLSPRARVSALRLCAEAVSAEAAEELCARMAEQVRRLECRE